MKFSLLIILTTALPCAAQNLYFDTNGPNSGSPFGVGAGFGSAGASAYLWGSSTWTSNSSGSNTSTTSWIQGRSALFYATNDAGQIYSVNAESTQREISGLDVKNGSLSIFGAGGILLGGATGTTLNVENDSTGTARSVTLDTVVSGTTTNTPSITKTGSGTLIFSGANTATAPMIVVGGKLQIGNGGTTGSIASSSLEIGTDATVVVNINASRITYGGVITGSGVITKRGSSSLTLSGNSTHTGLLEILEGSATLNGNIRSNIQVTAPLFGRGSTTGSLTLKAGGVVAPDDSNPSRILTVGSLTMDPHSSSATGILDCTLVPPAFSFDATTRSQMLRVTGSVNLNNISPRLSFLGSIPAQSGFTYTVIDKTSSGPVIGTFSGLPEGAYLPTAAVSGRPETDNNYFRISYLGGDGNDITVKAIAATEVTPTISNVSITPSVSGDSSSPMNVSLNFSYLPYLSNTVRLQTSTDLVNWTTHTTTFSTNASGSANINAVIIGTSQANTPKLFVRISAL